jgi:F0F1-type ATP synthase membrane subunit a
MLPLLAFENPLEHVLPHTYFHVLGIPVTNVIVMSTVAGLLMLLIFPRMFDRPSSGVPSGSKNFFEAVLEFLRVEVFRPALKENTDRFVPFLWTMFFFILFCNVLGCLPIAAFVEIITWGHVEHLGGAATGNISVTIALALCAFVFIHAHGIDQIAKSLMDGTYGHHDHGHAEVGHEDAADLQHFRGEALAADAGSDLDALTNPTAHYKDESIGLHGVVADYQPAAAAALDPANTPHAHERNAALVLAAAGRRMTPLKAMVSAVPIYLWNFAPHPFRPPPGSPWTKWIPDVLMFSFLLLLEMIGAAVKPFALCIRLFANMVAGHILLAVLIGLIMAVPGLWRFGVAGPIALLDVFIQLLEIFVAFLQAYIFTFLTTLFIASAVAPEH